MGKPDIVPLTGFTVRPEGSGVEPVNSWYVVGTPVPEMAGIETWKPLLNTLLCG